MNASVNESAAPGSLFAEALPGGAVCKGDVCRGSMWHPGIEDDPATIPRYTLQGLWWLVWLVGVEYVALWWQGARLPDLHDNIMSLVHGTLYEVSKLFVRGLEYGVYVWAWNKYSIFPPLGNSFLEILFVIVLVDFGFYWFHRASHEIMVLWAVHQVHHSGEEFTVSVGLRNSPLQRLFSWVFYLPLAVLGVPPAHMLAHVQFSALYQCWIHTETIRTVGPLEYVFNTPAHHRVHHGCNKYCLDKNYGGIFIVWDRLFGTFQPELPDQEIVYGIVYQPSAFNPLYHQVFYLAGALKKARSMSTWGDFVAALVKGPSWAPGSPWTGWEEDKLDIRGPREHQPVSANQLIHLYALVHFWASLTLTSYLAVPGSGSPLEVFVYSCVVVAALTCIGVLYEDPPYIRTLEVVRCSLCLALCLALPLACTYTLNLITSVYTASLLLWLLAPSKALKNKID